ncbi:hypothetical protein ACOME3_001206 [Neoechinorhynchus agilis]
MVLTKFETKSARVKGLSFHSIRPWILASLHTGQIQLWDIRVCALIDRFEEHDGPVRGIDFHGHQPLFVSGGDDYKVKVWNVSQRRCLFTLHGHLDYVRTTFFHSDYPWIVSASDDQTIRIWNWQSRTCVCVLTGHNHYVMCAQFHPSEDLIISASLDQTVRIWDISGLRRKNVYSATSLHNATDPSSSLSPSSAPELFGQADAVVRFVLEGHSRGVNWAAFHPTLPFAVSAADDRFLKIWRMNETKAWEADTLRGHFNSISCVVFAVGQESLIISIGEDKCLKIWSLNKRTCIQTVRRDNDRFWIIAKHPSLQLFAAGHDAGFIIFKLNRERPAFCVYDNYLFYLKEGVLRRLNFKESKDISLSTVVGISDSARPYSLSYNESTREALLVCRYTADERANDHYYTIMIKAPLDAENAQKPARTIGTCAVWISRSRYAVLSNNNLIIKSGQETIRNIVLNRPCQEIFSAFSGHVILREKDRVHLYNCQDSKYVGTLKIQRLKHVYWSPDFQFVALVSKNKIQIADREFTSSRLVAEEMCRIKSGVWADNELFLYTTANHIKYALTKQDYLNDGDLGIIRTVDVTLYLTKVIQSNGSQATLFCLDRSILPRVLVVNLSEANLKLSLVSKRYDEVMSALRENCLMGKSMISYLTKKNYPELALQFVTDPQTQFTLALQSGDLDHAVKIVSNIERGDLKDHIPCWTKLSKISQERMALITLEKSLQRLKAHDKLSFLYTLIGRKDKLTTAQKVTTVMGDKGAQFQLAMMLGDLEGRIQILRSSNQLALAYITAKTHKLDNIANEIMLDITARGELIPDFEFENSTCLIPLTAISPMTMDWPLLAFESSKKVWTTSVPSDPTFNTNDDFMHFDAGGLISKWSDSEHTDEERENSDGGNIEKNDGDSLSPVPIDNIPSIATQDDIRLVTSECDTALISRDFGHTPSLSPLLNLVIDGKSKEAFRELVCQIGLTNPNSFVSAFTEKYKRCRLVISSALPQPSVVALSLSKRLVDINGLCEQNLKNAYALMTDGKFMDAARAFKSIIISIPLVYARFDIIEQVYSLLETCRNYVLGIHMELERRSMAKQSNVNVKRLCELALYFSHCNLQRTHNILAIKTALNMCYKHGYYRTASICAQRLLELGPPADLAQKARNISSLCDQKATEVPDALLYDPWNPFEVCSKSFVPIYKNNPSVNCSFCGSSYLPEYRGSVCTVCEVAEIGFSSEGLKLSFSPKR